MTNPAALSKLLYLESQFSIHFPELFSNNDVMRPA